MERVRWLFLGACAGFLVALAPSCGTASSTSECTHCPGCCDASGHCRAGNTIGACGLGGVDCAQCAPAEVCHSGACARSPDDPVDAGWSDAGAACGASTCPGCCADDGGCLPVGGQTEAQCGLGGAACQACSGNQTCASGSCVAPSCADSCPGCCTPAGTCRAGTSFTNCGIDGEACRTCSGGQTCSGGRCVMSPCGPTTCAGCCTLGTCYPGTAFGQCGTQGQACSVCTPDRVCLGIPSGGGYCGFDNDAG